MERMPERRTLAVSAEVRAGADGKSTVRGYAYRFDELSADLGGFVERIAPGAGLRALERNDVFATFNHNVDQVLGRRSSGTLRVGEDADGGWYEIDLPDTTTGRDLAELVRRGDVKGSSFTFRVGKDGQRRAGTDALSGLPVREITDMDVLEVGPVVNPAYPTTSVALRSVELCLGVQLRDGDGAQDDDEPGESGDEPADEPGEFNHARALTRATDNKGGVH